MAEKKLALIFVAEHEYIRHGVNYDINDELVASEKPENASISKKSIESKKASSEKYSAEKRINGNAKADDEGEIESDKFFFGDDDNPHDAEMNFLFESISFCYIPLLKMFSALEKDGIDFSMTMVISPLLCTLLSDVAIQNKYVAHLDAKIELGRKELLRNASDKKITDSIKLVIERAQEDKIAFENLYDKNLVKAFLAWHKKGYVEFLGTTATPVFMPHYSDMTEVLNAQVETGLQAHKYFFGNMPDGFWLPEMGYISGVEKILSDYNLGYTVLNAPSVLLAQSHPDYGIFKPLCFDNSLGILARCDETDDMIFGEGGFAVQKQYRDRERDIGFYLDMDLLSPVVKRGVPRFFTGYSYWNKNLASGSVPVDKIGDPENESDAYCADDAKAQCESDADSFVTFVKNKLDAAGDILTGQKEVSVVCAFDARKMVSAWSEWVEWLECVIRRVHTENISLEKCSALFSDENELQKIKPCYGAWCGGGYGENLLSGKNAWMIRHVRKASERMVDLTERFSRDTGIKARLLNLGARELLLAQSSGWARMISEKKFPEYATSIFSICIAAFMNVFDSLSSNTVNTEWLTRMETKHPIFPWINYHVFEKKK